MPDRKRLDLILVEKGLAESRSKARALIMAGKVLVNTQRMDKPGIRVAENAQIALKGGEMPYVSRGGLKLEAALQALPLSVAGLICMDVGASTGGFTDCLLQHGAQHVYAVDVGYGQLAWKLRQDPRVTVIERANIRHLAPDRIGCRVDLVTADVSFISLKIVVPEVLKFLKPKARILALIKPQFEVGKGSVGKGGVVKNPRLHTEVLENLSRFFQEMGLSCGAPLPCPVLGPKGNQEYLVLLQST